MLGPRRIRGSAAIPSNAANSGGDYFSYYPSRPRSHNRRGEPNTPPLSAYKHQDAHPSSTSQAMRLISQYESMSTPSDGYRYAYPPHADPDAGAAPYDLSSVAMTKIPREKSTKKKQFVYDYRSNPGHPLQAPVNHHRGDLHGAGATKKAPSPIRQSLRNLIAVIKKGALGKKRDSSESYGDNAIGTLQRRKKMDEDAKEGTLKVKAKTKVVDPPPALDLRPNSNISIAGPGVSQPPKEKKATIGTLLYLTPSDSKPTRTRTWKTFTAVLDPVAHVLRLSSSRTNSTEISLVGCTDIRSLDMSKLSKAEAEGLEKATHQEFDKLKAFEIQFKDKSKEKFAAVGVRERAGWISTIWDAILPENKKVPPSLSFPSTSRSQSASRSQTPPAGDTPRPLKHQQHSKPIESPVPIPLARLSSLLLNDGSDSGSHDRSLPPLPPASPTANPPAKESNSCSIPTATSKRNHMNLHLEIPPLGNPFSPSIYPTTATSCGGDGTPEQISAPQPPFLERPSPSSTTVIRPSSFSSSYFASREPEPSSAGSDSSYHRLSTSVLIGTIRANLTTTPSPSQPTTPAQSPSIVHLSQLSVVRQRLAQIERSHSEVSARNSSSSTLGTSAGNTITTSGGLAALASLVEPSGTTAGRPGTPLRRGETRASPEPSLLSRISDSLDGESPSGTEKSVSTPKPTKVQGRILPTSLEGGCALSPPPPTMEPTKRRRSRSRSGGTRDGSSFPTLAPTPKKAELTKEDIEDVSKQVDAVKSVLGGQPGEPTIHEAVQGLEDKTRSNGEALGVIRERVTDIDGRLGNLTAAVAVAVEARSTNEKEVVSVDMATVAEVGREAQQAVLQAIEDVKTKLTTNFPVLVDGVKEVRSLQEKLLEQVAASLREDIEGKDSAAVLNNLPPAASPLSRDVDLKPILDKLDGLKALLETLQNLKVDEEKKLTGDSESKEKVAEQLEKILTHVQEESTKQTIFAHQQADSVRYLNELNNWLETFVTNGTSQIQGLSANIQHLSNALGCASDAAAAASPNQQQQPPTGALGPVSQALLLAPGISGSPPTNLLGDIRQLVVGMQARDQNFAALQSAVHSLLEVLSSSQAQMGAESQTIAGLITRQRQEQEALLRTFTSEISGEIKGERLRFVEAMKEATAINVQLHVEHFKQDLSREVMAMTEEVGRLHREKQIVENQISDLFAFYSKHKQQETPLQPRQPPSQANVEVFPSRREQEQPQRASIPRSSHYRPLPQPRRH